MNCIQSVLHFRHHERDILQKALKCPQIQALFDEANKVSSTDASPFIWQVRVVKQNEDAKIDWSARKITLNKNLTDQKALSVLALQLIFIVNKPLFDAVDEKATEKKISCELYIKEVSEIEHLCFQRHHFLMSSSVTEMGWNKSLDKFINIRSEFEEHWKETYRAPRTEMHRARYHALFTPGEWRN